MMNVIETKRLILRAATTLDAELVFELLNDPAFIRFVGDRGIKTNADAATYISNRIIPSYQTFGFGFYVVLLRDGGESVGICGLIKRDTLDDVDLGFSVRRKFWRNGYAYEAAAAVLQHARNTLGHKRIVGITAPENESSIAVLQKLGLHFERMIRLTTEAPETMLFG